MNNTIIYQNSKFSFCTNKSISDIKNLLKNLDVEDTNLVRTLIFDKDCEKFKIYNKLRIHLSSSNLLILDEILRNLNKSSYSFEFVGSLFPPQPQIEEKSNYTTSLPIFNLLKITNLYVKKYKEKIIFFVDSLELLNTFILDYDIEKADTQIEVIIENLGYSHFIIRKILLVNQMCEILNKPVPEFINNFLQIYNSNGQNNMITSLQQCYQEGVDYIGLKKAITNFYNKDTYFCTLLKLPFNYFLQEFDDNLVESTTNNLLRSSLIDALIYLYNHQDKINTSKYLYITEFFNLLSKSVNSEISIEKLAKFYLNFSKDEKETAEDNFKKQLSAWFELPKLMPYALLQTYFNDEISFDENALKHGSDIVKIQSFIEKYDLLKLVGFKKSILEKNSLFLEMIDKGVQTRSAIFNYNVYITQGNWQLDIEHLFSIMGSTRDLPRTINSHFMRKMAETSKDQVSKIIYYMLLSKKTKSDLDHLTLRKDVQDITRKRFEGSLVDFVDYLYKISPTVAYYAYELFSEDFIAKMIHIIETAHDITETRAKLHEWMSEHAPENNSAYKERARTLRIDHQINRIRNQNDDNRIYVDLGKFNEWLYNDAYRDLILILSNHTQYNYILSESTQLLEFIDQVYKEFCTNKVFGISSYLGRRIRHGTFKGHTFSKVNKSLEKECSFLSEPPFVNKWNDWKQKYEIIIDDIIKNNLHIESAKKKNGLIRPTIKNDVEKMEFAKACSRDLITDYISNSGTNVLALLVEYCWRFLSIDLKHINAFLKNQKSKILELARINLFSSPNYYIEDYTLRNQRYLNKMFQSIIDEKFKMVYDWFKRPQSVAPKASISLLFSAVIQEVRDTYTNFEESSSMILNEQEDIELHGKAYLVIYDALFVILFNAAKHGKENSYIEKNAGLDKLNSKLVINVSSIIKDEHTEEYIREKITVDTMDNVEDAQIFENKSGIKKLYHLQKYDKYFKVEKIDCENRKVNITISYKVNNNV